MKRDSRGNGADAPPKKMQKGDNSGISVRFLIPARAAGLIIGKGGETIKKIRSQYSVKLNIPETRGTERVFTVEGDMAAICNVWREVLPKLKDVMSAKLSDPKRMMGQQRMPKRKRKRDGDDEEEQEKEEDEDTMIDLRLLVHESIAGCIIGKGGERIRDFRQKHKMRVIKVYQMLAPCSSERVIQLVGEPEDAINCLQSVVEVAERTPVRGPTEPYDANNFYEPDALTYGGWLSPEGLRAMAQGGMMPMGGGGGGPGGYNNMRQQYGGGNRGGGGGGYRQQQHGGYGGNQGGRGGGGGYGRPPSYGGGMPPHQQYNAPYGGPQQYRQGGYDGGYGQQNYNAGNGMMGQGGGGYGVPPVGVPPVQPGMGPGGPGQFPNPVAQPNAGGPGMVPTSVANPSSAAYPAAAAAAAMIAAAASGAAGNGNPAASYGGAPPVGGGYMMQQFGAGGGGMHGGGGPAGVPPPPVSGGW